MTMNDKERTDKIMAGRGVFGDVQQLRGDEDKSVVETVFRVFQPGRRTYTVVRHDMKREPGFDMLDSVIRPLLGFDVAIMEHVSVLYEGKAHDMFVDELGGTNNKDRLCPKPVNEAATEILHAYSKSVGKDMTDASPIHGVAVIAMRKVWY